MFLFCNNKLTMTSNQPGTSTAYGAIAPYRLYLDLHSGDVEFNSGHVAPWNETRMHSPPHVKYLDPNNILAIIQSNPKYQAFYQFVLKNKLERYIADNNVTVFIPEIDIAELQLAREFPIRILKNHLIDRIITPVELIDRRVRLVNQNGMTFTCQNMNIRDDSTYLQNKILTSQNCANGFIYTTEFPIDILLV